MIEVRFDDLKSDPPRALRFAGLRQTLRADRADQVPSLLAALNKAAAQGFWTAGFLSYEAAPGIDADLTVRGARDSRDPFAHLPLAWFGVFDRRQDVPALSPPNASYSVSRWSPSVRRPVFEAEVECIRDYIKAGDTYQVNHTMRLRAQFSGTDRAFYAALCLSQRGGHSAYVDMGEYRILSASPELFFSLDDGRLVTRPMKGTATRGRWLDEDEQRGADLLASAKDRAENAMIVDLLRNDMGRISVPGSVLPAALFDAERYETVWQLTSTIESRLRDGLGATDVIRTLFPSGSVTGAPKIRAMEIIAELEDTTRGAYTGSIGWIAPGGASAEFNVAIRTVVLNPAIGAVEYGVGGGITHDSIPAREYEECLAKSRVLTERRPAFELFETIARRGGEFVRLERHLDRMAASAAYFGFPWNRGEAATEIELSAGSDTDIVVRIELARGGAFRTITRPLPGDAAEAGVLRLELDEIPVDPSDVFLYHKTTQRRPYTSRAERHPGADDVVLTNTRGEITETTIANIAVKLGGRWLTPARDCGLLAGTYRAELIDAGELTETSITVGEFRRAQGIAVLSSVRGRHAAVLAS